MKANALLRAFPEKPGSSIWCVQNLAKRTEYRTDVEQMTCSCPGFGYRKKCRHLDYALFLAKLYRGDRATYEQFIERVIEEAA